MLRNKVLFGVLVFFICFAGFRPPQPASFFAHREDNFLFPNPQILTPGQWKPVEFSNVQWLGDQFTWNPVMPFQVNLARGPYHPIAQVVIQSNANLCQVRMVYTASDGTQIVLSQPTQLPSVNGLVVLPYEPSGFMENKTRGSSLTLEAQCDNSASISAATLYIVNQ